MGNTDSALQGMSDANNVMMGIPILGSAFQMQNAATSAGVNVLGGIGKLGILAEYAFDRRRRRIAFGIVKIAGS